MSIPNSTYRIFLEKLGDQDVSQFIGNEGELFFDPNVPALKLSDGSTPGGIDIVGGSSTTSSGSTVGITSILAANDVSLVGFNTSVDGQILAWNTSLQQFESSSQRGTDNIFNQGVGGYEFTGGFSDRTTGSTGISTLGNYIAYPQSYVNEQRWYRFGLDTTSQVANDNQYWGETDPDFDQTKGLFGGLHMPSGVNQLFDFSYNDAVGAGATVGYSTSSDGSLKYNYATGSFDFSQCQVGDLALVRFDFNVQPQIANTTLEVAMIWSTRNANNDITFTFPLTGSPLFYGTGTVGRTFLNRPLLTAYFASSEDVNARALLAIRADNPIKIAPLTTLSIIKR